MKNPLMIKIHHLSDDFDWNLDFAVKLSAGDVILMNVATDGISMNITTEVISMSIVHRRTDVVSIGQWVSQIKLWRFQIKFHQLRSNWSNRWSTLGLETIHEQLICWNSTNYSNFFQLIQNNNKIHEENMRFVMKFSIDRLNHEHVFLHKQKYMVWYTKIWHFTVKSGILHCLERIFLHFWTKKIELRIFGLTLK